MLTINIDNKNYTISNNYNRSICAWVETLDEDTRKLVLDYTILWNMVEHQVYDNSFNIKDKTDKCIKRIIDNEENDSKINYIWSLFKEYILKYKSIDEFYESLNFIKSKISIETVKKLYQSREISDKLK